MTSVVNSQITRDDAAALIPEDVAASIIKDLPASSAALALFRRVTMTRKQQRLPVLSVLPQAYWVGSDTGLKQTTNQEWANKYLNAEELAVILPVPEAVLDDSDFDIWGEVQPELVAAIGAKVDEAVWFGTDAPNAWPDSIVEGANAVGNVYVRGSVPKQDLAEDINQAMMKVEAEGFSVNGFAAHTGLKGSLRGLRDANGSLLFQPSLQAGTPGTLYGEQLYYTDANGSWDAAEADLICGDFRKGIVGIRQDISFKLFTEGVVSDDDGKVILNLMQQDAVAMRVTFRCAFQVANPTNRMKALEAERYPFALLQPAGYGASA